jgi:uncharacterized membrane protein
MNRRPILSIPMTTTEKTIKILSVLMIAIQFFYVIYTWNDLPAKVPTHFNAAGKVDGWGEKGSLWLLPTLGLLLFVGMSFLERVPHVYNYPVMITDENAPHIYLESRRLLVIINFEMTLFFLLISCEGVKVAFGHESIGVWMVPVFMVVVLGTIVISLFRVFRKSKREKG